MIVVNKIYYNKRAHYFGDGAAAATPYPEPTYGSASLAEQHCPKCGAKADPDDVSDACHIDIGFIRRKRRENASVLMDGLRDMLMFPALEDTDCPMFVPVIVPDGKRDGLRCLLTSAEIYCPVHWPLSRYHSPDETSMRIYDNELSLVCDQRYSVNDMDRIVETVKKFLREA